MSLYLGDTLISGAEQFVGESRNIGQIIPSAIPLQDAGLHLLDGSLINGSGIYSAFVDYIAELYNDAKVYNPSAFTVVGSPTITDDGIASGFSGSNGIFSELSIINHSTWDISFKFTSPLALINGNKRIVKFLPNNSFMCCLDGSNLRVWFGNGSSWFIEGNIITSSITTNTEYNIKIKFTGNAYEVYINNILTSTITSTTQIPQSITNVYIGYDAGMTANYFTGSIDLKQFSIIVDGIEVFSGSKPANYFTTEAQWQTYVNTYGVCGKFVYDNVNNTVRLPKITGIIEGTTDTTALGDLVQAGLPNITGKFNTSAFANAPSLSGAFAVESTYQGNGGNGHTNNRVNFDASRSSSIYGNSSTVQPQTIKVLYYIVIATSTKTDIEVDIDEIATDLNGKVDTDLSNCTDVANIKMAHNAMPSDTYIDLTLGASDTVYTAPADGWYSISKVAGADWYTIYLRVLDETQTNVLLSQTVVGYRTTELKGSLPIKKGQKFQMWYNAYGATNYFRFIYAVGSESEAE